jgi:hypothetical protein
MKRRQLQSGDEAGETVRHALPKLRALTQFARQLTAGNIVRLSKFVLLKVRLALHDVMRQDDHTDDMHVAQLIGILSMAQPNQRIEIPSSVADGIRPDMAELLSIEEGATFPEPEQAAAHCSDA